MSKRVDLYENYGHFTDRVMEAVRKETYGTDFGQNSWTTVDEYERLIPWMELSPDSHVLEVGSGSGYQTAVLKAMNADVYTIERLPELSDRARENVERSGFTGVHYRVGDGSRGWPDEAPFDRVIVTAGAPTMPVSLVEQLREGGLMVIPVGGEEEQELLLVRRDQGQVTRDRICSCIFVKLWGDEGW